MSPNEQRPPALGARESISTTPDPSTAAESTAQVAPSPPAAEHPDPNEAQPTERDCTEHDRAETNCTEHDGTQRDGTQRDGTQRDGTQIGSDGDARFTATATSETGADPADVPAAAVDAAVSSLGSGDAGAAGGDRVSQAEAPKVVPVPAKPTPRRSHRLLAFVATTALLMSMGAITAIGLGVYHYRTMLTQPRPTPDDDEGSTTQRAGLSAPDDDGDATRERAVPPSLEGVIVDTVSVMRGSVEVVDVGSSAASLPDVLLAQRIVADTKQQTLVLMLTGRRCDPCNGVHDAIDDPLMQQALLGVRLVRVDLEVFKDELKRLDLPTTLYPAFFLLGDDLRPIDAIHGGEWDDDVAKNIAPVLGPFVRGELRHRRHADWAPTTSSIPL